jgi:hypothetical protein
VTTPAEAVDYSQYAGKKVIITIGDPANDKPDEDKEGTVQTANAAAVLLKLKGKSAVEPILTSTIRQIVLAPDSAKEIKQRYLKDVEVGQVRQHLVDRHGFTLDVVNADDFTEEKAVEVHTEQHSGDLKDQLGHVHGERPKTERETAIAAAGETPEQAAEQEALAASDNDPAPQPGDPGDEDEAAF